MVIWTHCALLTGMESMAAWMLLKFAFPVLETVSWFEPPTLLLNWLWWWWPCPEAAQDPELSLEAPSLLLLILLLLLPTSPNPSVKWSLLCSFAKLEWRCSVVEAYITPWISRALTSQLIIKPEKIIPNNIIILHAAFIIPQSPLSRWHIIVYLIRFPEKPTSVRMNGLRCDICHNLPNAAQIVLTSRNRFTSATSPSSSSSSSLTLKNSRKNVSPAGLRLRSSSRLTQQQQQTHRLTPQSTSWNDTCHSKDCTIAECRLGWSDVYVHVCGGLTHMVVT